MNDKGASFMIYSLPIWFICSLGGAFSASIFGFIGVWAIYFGIWALASWYEDNKPENRRRRFIEAQVRAELEEEKRKRESDPEYLAKKREEEQKHQRMVDNWMRDEIRSQLVSKYR